MQNDNNKNPTVSLAPLLSLITFPSLSNCSTSAAEGSVEIDLPSTETTVSPIEAHFGANVAT